MMKKLLLGAAFLLAPAAAVWAQPDDSPAAKAEYKLQQCRDCGMVESVVEHKRWRGAPGLELHRHGSDRSVWVTTVRMRDGRILTFQQTERPSWMSGSVVHVRGNRLRLAN